MATVKDNVSAVLQEARELVKNVGPVSKLAIDQINPDRLRRLPQQEVLSLNRRTHQLYARFFLGNRRTSADGLSREDLINAQIFVIGDMRRRGLKVDTSTELNKEALALQERGKKSVVTSPSLENGGLELPAQAPARPTDAIYLVAPHAELIHTNEKSLMVKARRFDIADKPLLLAGPEKIYGVVVFAAPTKIDLAEFSRQRPRHRISDKERKAWWPDAKQLWAYPVKSYRPFARPRAYARPPGAQTFIRDVQLKADQDRPFAEIHPSGERDGPPISLERVLPYYEKPMMIRGPCVYLVGSLTNQGSGNDIDVLIEGPFDDATRQVVEFRIGRALPPHLAERLQFHDESLGGPFCLAGNRPVILRDRDAVRVRQLSALWEELEAKLGAPQEAGDGRQWYDLNDTQTIAWDGGCGSDALGRWEPLTSVVRKRYRGEMLLLRQKNAETEVTPNHSVYREDGMLVQGSANPPLLALRQLPLLPEGQLVDLTYLADCIPPPRRDTNRGRRCSMIRAYEGRELKDLLRVLLAYVSDGCAWESRRGVRVVEFCDDGAHLQSVRDALERLTGATGYLGRGHGDCFKLVVGNHELYWICKLLCGNKTSDKRLPDFVLTLPQELRRWAWDELRLGDGCDFQRSATNTQRIYSTSSRTLAGQVSVLLASLGRDFALNHDLKWGSLSIRERSCVSTQSKRILNSRDVDEWVYDLACAKNHSFVDAVGLAVVHNTCNIPLYDLVLVPREARSIVQMRAVEKQDDPLLEYPPKPNAKHDAVWQLHFRGKSVHVDFRLLVNPKYLVGWTIVPQIAGKVPDVDSVEQARSLLRSFSPEGSNWNKPFVAPKRLLAAPKLRHPTAWMRLKDQVIEEGSVGATRFEAGVFVTLDRTKIEWGLQKSLFHEYFQSGAKDARMNGVLFFRQLVGAEIRPGIPAGEEGRTTPRGRTFWTFWVSKEYLPSVLKRRQVERGFMPPDGHSALPASLMEQTPSEFQYWKAKGKEAREIRDALVASHYFTAGNVDLVGGEIRRVERKSCVFLAGDYDEVEVTKAARVPFGLSWQWWKGPAAIRAAPSRQVWHLILDRRGKAEVFTLERNPLSEQKQITAIRSTDRTSELLGYQGEVKPGQRIGGTNRNATKATPSSIERVDAGNADLLADGRSFIRLRFDGKLLKGVWVLLAEEPGSDIWQLSKGDTPETKAVPERDGVQIWDPRRRSPDVDRTELEPLALFQPMKPSTANEFKTFDEVLDGFATPEALKAGVYVEPKWNGFRVVAEKKGNRVILFTEDEQRDISANVPSITKSLSGISDDFIIDAEFMEFVDQKPVPRRELARFRGRKPVDDRNARLMVFHILYSSGKNHTESHVGEMRTTLTAFLKRHKSEALVLSAAKLVHTAQELRQAVAWAYKVPGSEGAMFKAAPATYTLGGQTSSWAKIKQQRQIRAVVYDRHPVKGQTGVFNFFGAVGPVPKAQAARWRETVEVRGLLYVPIGKTFSAKQEIGVGDVVVVSFTELLVDKSAAKWTVRWFTPTVVGASKERPNTVEEVVRLAEPDEIKDRIVKLLPVDKQDADRRIVFGVVLEPGTVDAQGDTISAAEIEAAAHRWLARYQDRGVMHQRIVNSKIEIYESYVAPADLTIGGRKVKKGTWLLMYHVLDDDLWRDVKTGKLTGFSMGGFARRVAT